MKSLFVVVSAGGLFLSAAALAQLGRAPNPRVQAGRQQPAKTAPKQKANAGKAAEAATKQRKSLARGAIYEPTTVYHARRLSDADKQADFPAAAVTTDGALWSAWVVWAGGNGDNIVVRRLAGGDLSKSIPLAGPPSAARQCYQPTLAPVGTSVLCVFSAQPLTADGQPDGPWGLHACLVRPDGTQTPTETLTVGSGNHFHVRAAAAPSGQITIVWQSFRGGTSDIYLRQRTPAGLWTPEVRVSPSEANDWEPAVAIDRDGTAWIAWDSYHTGDYNVQLRNDRDGKLGPVVPITAGPEAEFHASVACDPAGRVWVAWDTADRNWGKDFSPGSGTAAPGSAGLHRSRALGLRVYADGRLFEPAAKLSAILKGRLAAFAELPHLACDRDGSLWMVFRHWTLAQPHEIYHFYATELTADGWSMPARLAHSSGQNTQHAALALGTDGRLRAVYSSDGRSPDVRPVDAQTALKYNVYAATLPAGNDPAGKLPLAELPPVQLGPPAPAKERYTTTIGGKTYYLMTGDCHRHTDIRGHSSADGSILDTYRYALDAAALDFLGMGDHNQATGGTWFDGLRDYQWWWTQKAADLFYHPPQFVTVYSFEHSLGTPSGHRNIIFLKRGAKLRVVDRAKDADNQPPNLWQWMRDHVLNDPAQRVVIVPHTFAEANQPRALWDWPNPPFEPLLEIYQGARSSYEAPGMPAGQRRGRSQVKEGPHFAQDALAKGYKYGFVSFSDHNSTHNSLACVYAEEPTRRGVIDAMLARRTFAASDDIVLDVTCDGRAMGSELSAAKGVSLAIRVRAANDLLRVDLVKSGRIVWSVQPEGRSFRATFNDLDSSGGDCYYYVRAMQRDIEKPDGDPEMAWGSPFFVKYE